jgi:hypothetical protein
VGILVVVRDSFCSFYVFLFGFLIVLEQSFFIYICDFDSGCRFCLARFLLFMVYVFFFALGYSLFFWLLNFHAFYLSLW